MNASPAPIRILAMDMYFMAAVVAVPSGAIQSAIQARPILIHTSQPALPQHTIAFRRLKAISGLSMTRLAELLGVERRTLYFWDEGKPILPSNENHLEAILGGIEDMGEVSPELMRRSLMAMNEHGICSADRFREHMYKEAVDQLGTAILNHGNSSVAMRGMGHRGLAQILRVEESDEGVPEISRVPKRIRIPRKAPASRA